MMKNKEVNMKKTNARQVIRTIVREEVAMAIQEVITELKKPTQQVSQPKPKKRIVEKKQFSKNKILNEVLNQTEGFGTEDYPTMSGEIYDTNRVEEVASNRNIRTAKSTSDILVSPDAPVEIKNIFNKDFKGILKKSMDKSKNK